MRPKSDKGPLFLALELAAVLAGLRKKVPKLSVCAAYLWLKYAQAYAPREHRMYWQMYQLVGDALATHV